MSDTMQFTIGAEITCSDGVCGDITRVVVDPVARAVTDLVVEPKHRRGLGRLVPLDLVDVAADGKIRLRCTQEEFDTLDSAEETEFLPGSNGFEGYEDYGPGNVLYQPYYGLGMRTMGMGMGIGGLGGNFSQPVTYDTLPMGDVGVRRGESVSATDGEIGKVQGLVIDPRNHHVTHVLLQEGHLWGQRQVAIPIKAITKIEEGGACLSLTKDEVRDLPPVEIDD
jgi:sporulation protein YlmC with PRC-barrel domain